MIFGHRGARGEYPENSIEGFLYAASLGIYGIEMDVCISGDKKVLVSHEPRMNHKICSNPDNSAVNYRQRKNLYRMNYETIRKYDCGLRGNHDFPNQRKIQAYKPLLAEVIEAVEEYTKRNRLKPIVYNIEIKSKRISDNLLHPPPAEFVELVMQDLLPFGIDDRIILQSFDMRPLKIMKQKYPRVTVGILLNSPHFIGRRLKTLSFTPDTCGVNYKYVTIKWLERIHQWGMKALVWTENEPADMQRHLSMGVDGIITDYPERAINAVIGVRA